MNKSELRLMIKEVIKEVITEGTPNVVYAYHEGGKDRYHCVWSNSDGETVTKDVYGKSDVEKFKKTCSASKIVWVD